MLNRLIKGLVVCASLLLLAPTTAAAAGEVKKSGWTVPSTSPTTAKYLGRKFKTVDGVQVEIRGYRTKVTKVRFNTVAVRSVRIVFCYVMFISTAQQEAYVDRDCDGVFETRYNHQEEWSIPACAQINKKKKK